MNRRSFFTKTLGALIAAPLAALAVVKSRTPEPNPMCGDAALLRAGGVIRTGCYGYVTYPNGDRTHGYHERLNGKWVCVYGRLIKSA